MSLLTADQLGEVLERTRRDLFRIETLPSYDTAMTTGDFRRWLDGETEPTWEVRQPWLDTLAKWARDGRPRRRVRVIHDPPSDYEQYACDWGYRYNVAAGEPTRVLDLAEQGLPEELDAAPGDWWLIDDGEVVTMHYHSDGQFRGAEVLDFQDVAAYRVAADAAWRAAELFNSWWDRHPQHHRTPTRTA
ncbi:MAG: hypothetical protein GEU83_15755 [Pseudonocardiaceae bacterium]|nr:hypothetical protein [Pseudonocardiaceae bacterium]